MFIDCFFAWVQVFSPAAIQSLPEVLRWITYSVEPFGFKLVPHDQQPPLLNCKANRLGNQPGLFDQANDCQTNKFQDVHRMFTDVSHLFFCRGGQVLNG